MTMTESLAMAVLLALPGVGFLLAMTIGRGSLVAGIAGSSLAGSATGAYIGAYVGATSNVLALDPTIIAIRGGVVGLGIGVGVGVVLAAALFAWRSSRPAPKDAEAVE